MTWLPWASVLSVAFYVVAFYIGSKVPLLRPIAGTLVLVVIIAFAIWAIGARKNVTMTVPHFGIIMSLITLVIGSILGVLLGLKLSGKLGAIPDGVAAGHPTMQVIGYLILAAVSFIEAVLIDEPKKLAESKPGIAQVGLLFLAGACLSLGLLINVIPITALNVPLEIAAVVIFLSRMRSHIFKVGWLERTNRRHFGAASIFLVLDIGLGVYLVASIVSHPDSQPPLPLLLSLDHMMFVGVMTNCLFGIAYGVTRVNKGIWPVADHLVFWLMNIGVAGFVIALITETKTMYKFVTPVMGTGILIGIVLYTVRMWRGPAESVETASEETAAPAPA